MEDRIGWLDMARAIGIVAVVLGHSTSYPLLWSAMFHFHMPLFFMMSGMVFGAPAPALLARRRIATLLLPYAAWLLVVALADIAIGALPGHSAHLPWGEPAVALTRLLLGGTFLVEPFGIFWFVTCLFLVQIIAALLLFHHAQWLPLVTAASVVAALVMPRLPNPWGIISVPLALFFFLMGILHRRHTDRLGVRLTMLAGALAPLALLSRPLDLKVADAGTPVLSVLAALGLCHLVLAGARQLPRWPVVEVLGRASLVIMYVHLTIFYALRGTIGVPLLVLLSLATGAGLWMLLDRFDVTRTLMLGQQRPREADRRPFLRRFRHKSA
ncbi:acyltransferase family protein [Sphingomonas sp.]|jgi:fucose 4-O-acetylase-like acetyltransferase|uniref:acyltransferase family protein n=1 Tax=Sphingomonas sp. TaxID=28214 RepID=UPI00262DF11A|nr:acyltransferase family protein [Sphingomonas sp.]MDF2495838.1 glycosyl transferase [Sphingomonas sp.]